MENITLFRISWILFFPKLSDVSIEIYFCEMKFDNPRDDWYYRGSGLCTVDRIGTFETMCFDNHLSWSQIIVFSFWRLIFPFVGNPVCWSIFNVFFVRQTAQMFLPFVFVILSHFRQHSCASFVTIGIPCGVITGCFNSYTP